MDRENGEEGGGWWSIGQSGSCKRTMKGWEYSNGGFSFFISFSMFPLVVNNSLHCYLVGFHV